MASRTDVFTTKVFLNAEEAKKELDNLNKRLKQLNKERDEAASQGNLKRVNEVNKQIKEVTKSLDSTRTTAAKVSNVLDNLSGASIKQIQQTIKAINKEMSSGNIQRGSEEWKFFEGQLQRCNKELKEIRSGFTGIGGDSSRLKSIFDSTLGNFFGYLLHDAKDFAMEFIGSVKDMVTESTELAKSAEGIKMAFDRINQPGLLDNLRKATHGTVTDIELMKQAVKFKDFNLPVEQLGTYLAFAQQKAKDTGESIDFLVNSIVTGLGRQSPQILDNLGLSAKEISEEAKKSGDFFGAVASIVEKNMSQAGGYIETAAERSAQATTRLKNEQEKLGEALLPLREKAEAAYGTLQLKALQAVKYVFENRHSILELIKVGARWAIEAAIIAAAWNLMTIKVKIHNAYMTASMALHKGWSAVAVSTRAVMTALSLAWTLCTKGVKEFTIAMRAAKLASMANPWTALATVLLTVGTVVYELISHFKGEADAARKAREATSEFARTQRILKSVNEEANRSVAEEKTRFEQLRKTLMDSTKNYKERKAALDEIKRMCPEYHGQLTTENRLINNNVSALDGYVTNLIKAARAQAAFNKMVAIQENNLNHEQLLRGRQQNQQWAKNQLKAMGADENSHTEWLQGSGWVIRNGENKVVRSGISRDQAMRIRNLVELTRYNDKRIGQEQTILNLNQKQSEVLKKMVDDNGGYTPASSTPPITPTITPTNTPKGGGGGSSSGNTGEDTRYEKEIKLLEAAHKRRNTLLKEQFAYQTITEKDYQEQMLASDMAYYKDKIDLQKKYGQDTTDAQNSMLDLIISEANRRYREEEAAQKEHEAKQKEAEKKAEDERKKFFDQMRSGYEKGLKLADNPNDQLQILQAMLDQGLLSYEEYQQRKTEVEQDAESRRQEIREMFMQQAGQLMGDLSSLYSAMQQQEINAVEQKYAKQLEAARKAGRDTSKIEKKQQAEINAIKKKYAEKEFRMKVFQIIADTAVGIARLWADPGYPLAIPLTALVAASGAIQLATAKKAQEQAASEGYYTGSYTKRSSNNHEVAGVVHANEWVADHNVTRSAAARPFLDFFDQAKRNNRIGGLTPEDVAAQVVGGGGQTVVSAPTINVTTDNSELRESIDRLNDRLDEGIEAFSIIDGEQGTYRKMKQYERLIGKKS